VLDLKPWLAKFSYSIGLDVLAANAMDDGRAKARQKTDQDRAVFSMLFQRSAGAEEKPDRVMWQVRLLHSVPLCCLALLLWPMLAGVGSPSSKGVLAA
jgi:hypothetical protein